MAKALSPGGITFEDERRRRFGDVRPSRTPVIPAPNFSEEERGEAAFMRKASKRHQAQFPDDADSLKMRRAGLVPPEENVAVLAARDQFRERYPNAPPAVRQPEKPIADAEAFVESEVAKVRKRFPDTIETLRERNKGLVPPEENRAKEAARFRAHTQGYVDPAELQVVEAAILLGKLQGISDPDFVPEPGNRPAELAGQLALQANEAKTRENLRGRFLNQELQWITELARTPEADRPIKPVDFRETFQAQFPKATWKPEYALYSQEQGRAYEYARDFEGRNWASSGDIMTAIRRVPEDARASVLRAVRYLSTVRANAADKPFLVGRILKAGLVGVRDIAASIKEFVGAGGTEDEWHYYKALLSAQGLGDPMVREDDNWLQRSITVAGYITPQMLLAQGAGAVVGGLAKAAGAGRALTYAASGAGITAAMLPQSYSSNLSEMLNAGVSRDNARWIALASGIIEGAIESITLAPFRGANKAAISGAKGELRKFLIMKAKDFAGEHSEEVLQGWVSAGARVFATQLDKNAKDQSYKTVFMEGIQAGSDSIGPLLFVMGPSTVAGAAAVGARQRAERGEAPSRKQLETLEQHGIEGLPAGQDNTEANRTKWYESSKEEVDRLADAEDAKAKEPQAAAPVEEAAAVEPPVEAPPVQPAPAPALKAPEKPADLAARAAAGEDVERPPDVPPGRWRAMVSQKQVQAGLKPARRPLRKPAEPVEARPEEAVAEVPVVEPVEEPVIEEPVTPEPANVWKGRHIKDWARSALIDDLHELGVSSTGPNRGQRSAQAMVDEAHGIEARIEEYAADNDIKLPALKSAIEETFPATRDTHDQRRAAQQMAFEATGLTPRDIVFLHDNQIDFTAANRLRRSTRKNEREIGEKLSRYTIGKLGGQIDQAHPGVLNPDLSVEEATWELMQDLGEDKRGNPILMQPLRADTDQVLKTAVSWLQENVKSEDYLIPEKKGIPKTPEEFEEAQRKFDEAAEDFTPEKFAQAMTGLYEEEVARAKAVEAGEKPEPKARPRKLTLKEPKEPKPEAAAPAPTSIRDRLSNTYDEFKDALAAFGELSAVYDPKREAEKIHILLKASAKLVYDGAMYSIERAGTSLWTFAEFLADLRPEIRKRLDVWEPHLRKTWQFMIDNVEGHRLAPLPAEKPPEKRPPAEEPPEEAPEAAARLVGLSRQLVKEFREQHGLPGFEGTTRQTFAEAMERGRALWESNPDLPAEILAELDTKPRALEPDEIAVMTLYNRNLVNRLDKALEDKKKGRTPEDRVAATARATKLLFDINELHQLTTAPEGAGTAAGRALVFRKMALDAEFTLAAMTRKAAAADKDLSVEEAAELRASADRMDAILELLREVEVQKVIEEAVAAVARAKPKKVSPAERKTAAGQRATRAVTDFKEKWAALTTLGAVYDPKREAQKQADLLKSGIELVRAYVDLGAKTFREFIARTTADIGRQVGEMEGSLKTAWDHVKKAGDVPELKVDPDKPESIGRLARKLTRSVVESGITDREAVIDAVHEDLADLLGEEWTRRQTMDAISGYGRFKELPKDEISKEVRRISGELQQLAKLEDMAAGKAPRKTGIERREVLEAERRLTAEVNEAKKRGGYEITDPERQLKSALASAETAIENQIADLEQEIRTGELIVKERKLLKPSPRLEALRKRRDELKVLHEKAFPKEPLTDEQKAQRAGKVLDRIAKLLEADLQAGRIWGKPKAEPISTPELEAQRAEISALRAQRDELRNQDDPNRAYRTALATRLARVKQRLADEDFGPRPLRKERKLSEEEVELLYEYEQIKRELQSKELAWKRANRSPVVKALGWAYDIYNVHRAFLVSFDLPLFRQAAAPAFGHPLLTAKIIWPALKGARSRKTYFINRQELESRETWEFAKRVKMRLSESDRLTAQDEAYIGRLIEFVPGLAQSQWLHSGLLDRISMDLFDGFISSMGGLEGVTKDEGIILGNLIDVSVGRAHLGIFEQAAVGLAGFLFSPRWVWSRFLLAVGQPIWTFRAPFKATLRARKIAAKEVARTLISMAAFSALMKMAAALLYDDDDEKRPRVEWDPRSADLGRVIIKNTRLDLTGGLGQVYTLIGRGWTGEMKRGATGEIVPLRGPDVPYGGMTMRSYVHGIMDRKLAPGLAIPTSLLFGETAVYEKPVTLGSLARNYSIPFSVREVYQALKDLGVPEGAAVALLVMLSVSTSTWEARKKKSSGVLKTLRVKK